jgi:hypothetical protein
VFDVAGRIGDLLAKGLRRLNDAFFTTLGRLGQGPVRQGLYWWPMVRLLITFLGMAVGFWALCLYVSDTVAFRGGLQVNPWTVSAFITMIFLVLNITIIARLWAGEPVVEPRGGETFPQVLGWELLFIGYLGLMGALVWALLTFNLTRYAGGRLASTDGVALSYNQTVALFFWQLADVVPLVDIPATVKWTEPGPDRDTLASVPLLAYKVLAVAPLLAVARRLVARRRGDGSTNPLHTTAGPVRGDVPEPADASSLAPGPPSATEEK